MLKILISEDWFFKDENGNYEKVDIPHDYQIKTKRNAEIPNGWSNGYYPTGQGTYVKHLTLNKNTHYVLDVDGAYMNTQVILNENTLTNHPYGFTPMLVDLTPFTIEGTNKLKITTNPLPNSARWYTGNGIYRDIFLWEGGRVRIEPWDYFITTSINGTDAKVKISFTVKSDVDAFASFDFSINEKNGKTVSVGKLDEKVIIGENMYEYTFDIKDALLWDTDTPNLYEIIVNIRLAGEIIDTTIATFGIREIKVNATEGLILNGKPIKLRGGCIHHDHGVLGAAAYPAAEERKVRLLKDCGFNAIRTAHNPPSLAFLEVCDRLGVIVMDEAFDTWRIPKVHNDYHLFFDEWCLKDISYMVLRDRNHPSVFSYSIGNEILEIDGTYGSGELSKLLSDEIRKYDSTRLVTAALQKDFLRRGKTGEDIDPPEYKKYLTDRFMKMEVAEVNDITSDYEAPLDIVGNNYYYDRYEKDHEYSPDRVIWGSETMSIFFNDSWEKTANNPYVLGDFTWVAFDNMGEVGCGRFLWERDGVVNGLGPEPYPWRTCYQGDHEITGKRRPQSYFREMMWKENTEPRIFVTHPEHYNEGFSGTRWHWYDVRECWSYDEQYIGKPISVETYTRADEIEWILNGRIIGRSSPNKGIATLNTTYEPGEICAVAYKDGKEVSRYTLRSFGKPERIILSPEKENLVADGRDLLYVRMYVTDGVGTTVDSYEGALHCSIEGGEMMGFFSGDPKNEDQYGSASCHAFGGEAVLIVRTKKKGKITIRVHSDNLMESQLITYGI